MSEGLWTTKSLMPSEKEKKPLEEASGHFSLVWGYFPFQGERRGRPSWEHCLELLGWPASPRSLPSMEI